jgi:hypothetical protein
VLFDGEVVGTRSELSRHAITESPVVAESRGDPDPANESPSANYSKLGLYGVEPE